MARFYLVRHGETDWNRERRVMGIRDIPLSSKGGEEVEHAAGILSRIPFDAIYTSPVRRARDTAEIISKHTGIKPTEDKRLTEIGMKTWEGKPIDDLIKDESYRNFLLAPKDFYLEGIERVIDVQKRGVAVVKELSERYRNGSIMLISHGDVIRSILCYYMHIDLNYMRVLTIETGSISILNILPGEQEKVVLLNHTGQF